MATYVRCTKCGHLVEIIDDRVLGCEYCLEKEEEEC